MRPPLNAGENGRGGRLVRRRGRASMRPPLNAGENVACASCSALPMWRFNEAPAERGGKPCVQFRVCVCETGFNEAPAERGGKRMKQGCQSPARTGFNEAPAERGGKPRQ